MYPLLQAYDSVALQCDVELGGTDQKFNLLVGRHLQQLYGQTPQCVMTVPLLEGLDGVHKMSKSLNNYIGIAEPPIQMFGKVMSISDVLMWRWYELLSFRSLAEIELLRAEAGAGGLNPRDIKLDLAVELVARFHGAAAAEQARADFLAQFSRGQLPADIPEIRLEVDVALPLPQALKQAGLVASTSDAVRMIGQRAVRVDHERVEDRGITLAPGATYLLQVGSRRYARLTLCVALATPSSQQ
jgi:tyrosyl-tRNA synthetase